MRGNNYRHGMYGTKFYGIYRGILSRCNNKNDKVYKFYGGRGIKCKWKSFEDFKKDMYDGYQEALSIERINNNGNYLKENCRWATRLEQCRNRRSNIIVTFKGKTQCLIDWANELKINYGTLKSRLQRSQWSVERAFTCQIKTYLSATRK